MSPNCEQKLLYHKSFVAAWAAASVFWFTSQATASLQSYQQACYESAPDPEFCITMLSRYGLQGKDVASGGSGRFELVNSAMKAALDGVNEEVQISKTLGGAIPGPDADQAGFTTSRSKKQAKVALDDCVEMLMDASELIGDCLSGSLANATSSRITDIHTWMSSALTYQATCLDGLSEVPPGKDVVTRMRKEGNKVGKTISTALSFLSTLSLDSSFESNLNSGMRTSWVPTLLEKGVTPNVVVAQDGTGRYTTISAAIDAAPSKSASTYIIYIKAGTYKEKVSVPNSKTNLVFVGDGAGKTIITGSKSVQDGVTTFKTASVEINGRGFLCRDLTIQNTAGPAKHQAVALRVSADKVAFYKCTFEGYQDTLYTHVFRQFYRECTIYGTVDFIFGDAAAVFQSCTILARVPIDRQKNTVTAQGRTDPNQNTGLAFQDCTLDGTDDLKRSGTRTYLGRPWKKYSRTVFLRCYESSVIDPAGWLEWSGNFALKTLFYAEYQCKGPGSGGGSRVSWSRQLNSYSEASKYTPGSFISGSDWLGQTNFPFALGL